MTRCCAILLTLALAAVAGCHGSRERAHFEDFQPQTTIRSISATVHVTMELEAGAPVALDGILVADLPHSYRLQLWKLGAPVLDVTRTKRGTWMLNRLAEEDLEGARSLGRANLQKGFALLVQGFRMAAQMHGRIGSDAGCLRTRTGAGPVECCPSSEGVRCTLLSRRGGPRASADFTAFRQVGSDAWPTSVSLGSQFGNLRLSLDEIEVDQPLGVNAFIPPRHARKIR